MDEKKSEAIETDDDWDELFGVSYAADPFEDEESEVEEEEEFEEVETDTEHESESESETESEEPKEENGEEQIEETEETEEAEEVAEEAAKPAEEAAAILEAIRKIDPSIESFNDLEDIGLFALLIDQGKTPAEALRESSPKLKAKLEKAKQATSKQHLRATGDNARETAVNMDAIKTLRRMYPDLSEREAIKLYQRVNAHK